MKPWKYILLVIAIIYIIAMIIGAYMYTQSMKKTTTLTGNGWDQETMDDYNNAMG